MKAKFYNEKARNELREEFKDEPDEEVAKWVSIVMQKFNYNQFGREKLFDVLEVINYDHQSYLDDAREQINEFLELPKKEQDPTKTVEVRYEDESGKSNYRKNYRKNLEKFHEGIDDERIRTLAKRIGASNEWVGGASREELFDFIEEEDYYVNWREVWKDILEDEGKGA